MKSNLFDRNGIEIQIGDKYKNYKYDTIYEIFWKGGCICGGINFEDAEPLCWEIDTFNTNSNEEPTELNMNDDLSWLELITTNLA